jgi:hypothetical protein
VNLHQSPQHWLDGHSTVFSAVWLQVALYPYYGTFPKKYDPSLDPWQNPAVGGLMVSADVVEPLHESH